MNNPKYCPNCGSRGITGVISKEEKIVTGCMGAAIAVFTLLGLSNKSGFMMIGPLASILAASALGNHYHKKSGLPDYGCNFCHHTWHLKK